MTVTRAVRLLTTNQLYIDTALLLVMHASHDFLKRLSAIFETRIHCDKNEHALTSHLNRHPLISKVSFIDIVIDSFRTLVIKLLNDVFH